MKDLSISFVFDLYQIKTKAEKRGDELGIKSLKQHYPELFTEEFAVFVEQTKLAMEYLDQKYGHLLHEEISENTQGAEMYH